MVNWYILFSPLTYKKHSPFSVKRWNYGAWSNSPKKVKLPQLCGPWLSQQWGWTHPLARCTHKEQLCIPQTYRCAFLATHVVELTLGIHMNSKNTRALILLLSLAEEDGESIPRHSVDPSTTWPWIPGAGIWEKEEEKKKCCRVHEVR